MSEDTVVRVDVADHDVADHIGQDLVRLLRVVTHLKHRHGDIAVAQVLVQLAQQGPQRIGEIAAAVGADPSTVSRRVSALVEAGLVERQADPHDGRAHLLAATESGARYCADGRRKRNDMITSVMSGWPAESRHRLAELLGRFADDMQELDRRSPRRSGGEN